MLNVGFIPNISQQSFGLFNRNKSSKFDTQKEITNTCLPDFKVTTTISGTDSLSKAGKTEESEYDEDAVCLALNKLHKRIKDPEIIVENRQEREPEVVTYYSPEKIISADLTIGEEKFKAEALKHGDSYDLNIEGPGREKLKYSHDRGRFLTYTDPDGKNFAYSFSFAKGAEGIQGNIIDRFIDALTGKTDTSPYYIPDPVINYNSSTLRAVQSETQRQLQKGKAKEHLESLNKENTDDIAYYEHIYKLLDRIEDKDIKVENLKNEKLIPDNVIEPPTKKAIKADVTVGDEKFQVAVITQNGYFEDLIIKNPDNKESLEFHRNSFQYNYVGKFGDRIPVPSSFIYTSPEGKRYMHNGNYWANRDQNIKDSIMIAFRNPVLKALYNES